MGCGDSRETEAPRVARPCGLGAAREKAPAAHLIPQLPGRGPRPCYRGLLRATGGQRASGASRETPTSPRPAARLRVSAGPQLPLAARARTPQGCGFCRLRASRRGRSGSGPRAAGWEPRGGSGARSVGGARGSRGPAGARGRRCPWPLGCGARAGAAEPIETSGCRNRGRRVGSPVSAAPGYAHLWHRASRPLQRRAGSRAAPARAEDQCCPLSGTPSPQRGPRARLRGDHCPGPPGASLFPWTAACPGLEWRRRNEHPAPIRAPVLSPQSPSFALLRQHLGLALSRTGENLRKPGKDLGDKPPAYSTAWKSSHLGTTLLPRHFGGAGLQFLPPTSSPPPSLSLLREGIF